MPICEHFVFTAAKIGINEGYQIIAKSEKISNNITQKLQGYLFPLGVDLNEFKKSKSLVIIDRNTIVYSIVKNIGVGYDGRKGTLYNHSFVINKSEFQKIGFDSRVFDRYFIENYNIRGKLPPIKLEETRTSPNFELLKKINQKILRSILQALLKKSKVALVDTNDTELIQNVLALLPPSLRLISFSTMVYQPDIQYKYSFIQIPTVIQKKLNKEFVLINSDLTDKEKIEVDESLEILLDIVDRNDKKTLEKIHEDCERVSLQSSQVKHIKITEIFDESEFVKLAKSNDFQNFERKVKNLYSTKEFNEIIPSTIVQITKKIRKIIKKELKKKKDKKKEIPDSESIISTIKILLDSMNYLKSYKTKELTKLLQADVPLQIDKLQEMLTEYFPRKKEQRYAFDGFNYMKTIYEQASQYYWNVVSMFIWGKK